MGIIHRDIKPQNILVDNSTCIISDFGTCILNPQGQIRTGCTGTIEWQAPELFYDEQGHLSKANEKCDIWSLGLILYYISFGHLPWKNSDRLSIHDFNKLSDEIRLFDVTKHVFPQGRSQKLVSMMIALLQRNPVARPSAREILNMRSMKTAKEVKIEPLKVKRKKEKIDYNILSLSMHFALFLCKVSHKI